MLFMRCERKHANKESCKTKVATVDMFVDLYLLIMEMPKYKMVKFYIIF